MTKPANAVAVVAFVASLVSCSREEDNADKGADLAACQIQADKAFPNHDIIFYSDRVTKCMRVRGWHFTIIGDPDHLSPDLCTDQLGNSALQDWCYERTSPEKRETEIN